MSRVIVIGAGWAGLVAAKTYLEIEPEVNITIVDNETTLGGTWCKDRLYTNLVAEAHYGLFEYSDHAMSPEGIQSDGRIPGSSVHRYLDEYATKFDLQRRIRLGCTVKSTEWNHELKTWSLGLVGSDETLSCDKLIVATGLTSKPSLPAVPHDTYHGEILHAKSLGHPDFFQKIQDPTVERVLVYGGSKSAFDTVHMLLQMGKQIDWVIRPGNGSSVMSPLSIFGTRTFRLSNTRFMGLFSPTAYDLDSRWHKAIHGPNSTNIARSGVKYFWKVMAYLTMRPAQYGTSENGKRLFPQLGLMSLFWSSATLGVMTHPELWNEIHRNSLITVSRKVIRNVSQDTVHFTDGSHHRADMVILATGWQADHSIFAGGDGTASSGTTSQPHDAETENRWTMLEQDAEREIIMKLPLLQETPTIAGKTQSSSSNILYRLYRHIVPITDPRDIPSIAFIGMLRTTGAPLVFEAQALWAVAYLTGKIKSPPEQEMRSHTALVNAWIKRRYLCGLKVPFALFDFMSYIDILYRDLGVNSRRKGNFVAEIFGLYTPRDFKGVVQEFLANQDSEKTVAQTPVGATDFISATVGLPVRKFSTWTWISLISVFIVALFLGVTAQRSRY